MRQLVRALEAGAGAVLDVEVDVAATAGPARAQPVVPGHLRRAGGGDRLLDPVHLGARQRFVDQTPRPERRSRRKPAQTIATATISAVIGSKAALPVTCTRARPKSTPAEVIASVRRWAASASSACDSVALACRESTVETTEVGEDRERHHGDADAEPVDFGADDELVRRLVDDHPGAEQDQHPLDRGGEVFDLLVAVGMLGVGRLVGFADREVGDRPRRPGRSASGPPR